VYLDGVARMTRIAFFPAVSPLLLNLWAPVTDKLAANGKYAEDFLEIDST